MQTLTEPLGKQQVYIAWLKVILLMVLVIALGMLAVNQTLGFYYKAELLQKPCDLCVKLNPDYTRCGVSPSKNITINVSDYDLTKYHLDVELPNGK